mmetsp:Transcript_76344/g.210767  ORF Transcript_76344/g.210767 Transcript_76344/m.210767 type:complete len:203 (+) Transcript_76344:485-1093(+)
MGPCFSPGCTGPMSNGASTLRCSFMRSLQARPLLSPMPYSVRSRGTSSPMGSCSQVIMAEVVPPKRRRKAQMRMKVALINACLVSLSTTPGCNSVAIQRETPPRQTPPCHIMTMCFHEMKCRFSAGKRRPTIDLTAFARRPNGNTATARETRTKSMIQRLRRRSDLLTFTAEIPTKMKISMSHKDAICFSMKDASTMPSAER